VNQAGFCTGAPDQKCWPVGMLNPADLPDDITALKALLVASEGRNLRKQDRIDQLERLVADFKRALFGARSEKMVPE
jgi:transposase